MAVVLKSFLNFELFAMFTAVAGNNPGEEGGSTPMYSKLYGYVPL